MKILRKLMFWLVAISAVALVAVAALWPQPERVESETIEAGWMEVSVQEEGKTRIKDRYIVSAPVGGQLLRIELRPGDGLEHGETLLATIQPGDPSLMDARQVSQTRAKVEAAKAQVKRAEAGSRQAEYSANLAEENYGRGRELRESKAISSTEFDKLEAEFRLARERLRAANFEAEIATFELQQAEAALQHFTSKDDPIYRFEISSPIDGQVLKVFQESATVITPGTPLLEVGNPLDLEVVVDVLSSDAVQIEPGDSVELTQWGGERPLLGTVSVVEPAAFTRISSLGVEEQRVNVVADFREPAEMIQRLGDGYRVVARIIVWKQDQVVKLPNSALFQHEGQWAVFRIQGDRARRTQVKLGKRNEFHAQVLEGLSVGQQVVTYPSDLIEDGTLIQVQGK